ncbi:S-DNA-T family DNA segregation ATPase FtsK/SpoIIIE [Cryobacterium roopkundense]|uniref:S-DNA-T family DNA segregation ATPase FtsK/SpoIIIE n=1 Tax=Cryobacterium roopkundense TaxID=1001240 RepID=A0A7W8ZT37_9MICO|nr:FtsK/SpoIIIE domain-containing protein [Cryobacterium roopkundense]MBB5639485.1 S-DNA-T family DNA segregation ATPase FtsK/SpoIIIE [Cryobacterium roopkundense]
MKVTFARPDGRNDDIVVTTDAAASIADVAGAIARVDPRSQLAPGAAEQPLTLRTVTPGGTDWLLLPPDALIGEDWVGSGASVALADSATYYLSQDHGAAATLAVIDVLSGPDAGARIALGSGTTIVGRGAECDVVLSDKLVSKRHVRLEVAAGVDLVDLGSANGVVVDGGLVSKLRIEHTETVQIGDSRLRVTVVGTVAATGDDHRDGPIYFNRSPRVETRYAGQEFAAPEVPTEKDDQPFPWLAMVAPVVLGVSMWVIFDRPAALLFVLMSPMMLIGNFFMNRSKDKRHLKRAIGRFDVRLAALSAQLLSERTLEQSARLGESPSTADALAESLARGPLMWTRRPEHWSFLNVRLGVGTMRSRNTIDASLRGELLPEFQERLDAVMTEHATVEQVPLIDNLFDAGALGVAGGADACVGTVNSLLVQLTALHSPAELAVASLVTPRWSRELEWLKWLPHTSSPQSPLAGGHLADSASSAASVLAALEEVITQRQKSKKSARRGAMDQERAALERGEEVGSGKTGEGTQSPIPAIIVVISDDVDVDRARLVQLAENGADAGVYPIWVARNVAALPAVCRTSVAVDEHTGLATVSFVRLGEAIADVALESVDSATALHFARRQAPVIDAGALIADSSDLPRSVSMVTLLGHDLVDTHEAAIDRWRQNASIHDRTPGALQRSKRAGTLRAIVGSTGVHAMHLDLRTQGPHALVGGTTGAGKSEFLQAWVLGMAAEYSPDRVSFLFVDYKGGSAFADCVSLPHCVGLVTDLSPHLVRRALTSLRAELRHREHLLNHKKAKDLIELEKRGDPDSPPALVLVIDEFAALVSEVPEFVDGVVDIAQRGRSLGIHLIMATQRPAGVIKDNLRANTNLRVALRMADESDSNDVVGVKDAAHFDPGLPGRGIAKTGPGRLLQFQSGYAGGWTSREPEIAEIGIAELRFGGETAWEPPADPRAGQERELGQTDQQKLVEALVGAARSARIPAPRRPWLDELPLLADLDQILQGTDAALALGLADAPTEQQQRPVCFLPDIDGHLGIYGTGGSGKSVALRTLAIAAGNTSRGGPVAVYGLDFAAGSLRMLEPLPHVGSIITGDDTERIIRLFRLLKAELESRGNRFAEANASTIAEYRTLANRPSEPRILLLIDGFGAFREEWEVASGRSNWYDVFRSILSDGRQLGIHVVFTADRSGSLPSSVRSSVQRRVVLRLADDTGYNLLDVPGDILNAKSAPGRAIVDGLETQVAIWGGSAVAAEQAAAVRVLASTLEAQGVQSALPIGTLSRDYCADVLPDRVKTWPVLGLSDETLAPVGFEPRGTLLVSGPPASGRSTTLRAITHSLRRFDSGMVQYYIGNARSGLAGLPAWAGAATTIAEAVDLAKELTQAVTAETSGARIAIVVENLADFLQTPADAVIVELIKQVKRSDHFLVADGETASWNSSWPLFVEMKNSRRGLLLQPDTIEGDIILKTPLPRLNRAEFPSGRGMMVAGGRAVRVQLPFVE